MSTTPTVPESAALAIPAIARIRTLADELKAMGTTVLMKAVEVGNLLSEAKAALPHGQWIPWLKSNFHFTDRTASKWMLLAKEFSAGNIKSESSSDLGINEALRLAAEATRPPLSEKQTKEYLRAALQKEIDRRTDESIVEINVPGGATYRFNGSIGCLRSAFQTLSVGGHPMKQKPSHTKKTKPPSCVESRIYAGLNDPQKRNSNILALGLEQTARLEEEFLSERGLSLKDFGLFPPEVAAYDRNLYSQFQCMNDDQKRLFLVWAFEQMGGKLRLENGELVAYKRGTTEEHEQPAENLTGGTAR